MIASFALAVAALSSAAAQDTTRRVEWSGFVDTYFAYDGGRPSADRSFTTQAVRHNEFNINLAHVGVALTSDRLRGRLALQVGTSVQSNYAGEPTTIGSINGPGVSRHIQEATAGYRVGRGLWVDAGIYFSYIGGESWISRDNANYTRSLVAEYSPYYLSGAKLTWQPTGSAFTIQVHAMNGWQNISETNSDKALGGRIDWQVTPSLTLGYANFIGNELPDTLPARTRVFNQVLGKLVLGSDVTIQGQFDYGTQGGSSWFGWVATARKAFTPTVAVGARVEQYSDPDQVILATGTANAFKGAGGSLNLDIGRTSGMLWRTEIRTLRAGALLFPSSGTANASKTHVMLVTSLALTL